MSDNLTGVWDGSYIQPGVGMITFTATLVETAGALGGSVTEPCMMPGCPLSTHNSSIWGHRSGSAVSFVGFGYDRVTYEGTVNPESTEIDGRWRVPGHSGSFLMIRAGKPAQVVTTEKRAKEPAR
jgi:hypothetical protein